MGDRSVCLLYSQCVGDVDAAPACLAVGLATVARQSPGLPQRVVQPRVGVQALPGVGGVGPPHTDGHGSGGGTEEGGERDQAGKQLAVRGR